MHDNAGAIALYRKLGFTRIAAVCVKRKNPINTPLFAARPAGLEDLNPYARIIAEEALRRGIRVEVADAESGELRLSVGGRTVVTQESLSEFTSAVAMSRCDDKRVDPPDHGTRGGPRRPGRGGLRGRPGGCDGAAARVRRGRGEARARRAGARDHRRRDRRGRAGARRRRSRCSSAPTSWSRSWSRATTSGSW